MNDTMIKFLNLGYTFEISKGNDGWFYCAGWKPNETRYESYASTLKKAFYELATTLEGAEL